MKTLTRFAIAVTFTLLSGLPGTVRAQSTPSVRVDTVQAIEIFPGIPVAERDTRFGVAFAGRVSGDLPGFLAATVNYTPANPGPNVTNEIVGGSWAITVRQNNRILGTVFGHVTEGTAVWDANGIIATIDATVSVEGGTKAFAGAKGTGLFDGTLDHTPLTNKRPPTLTGTLSLTF